MKVQSTIIPQMFINQNNLNKSVSFGNMIDDMEDEQYEKDKAFRIATFHSQDPYCGTCQATFAKQLIAMLVKSGMMKVPEYTKFNFDYDNSQGLDVKKLDLIVESDGTVKRLDLAHPKITTPEGRTFAPDLPDSFSIGTDNSIRFKEDKKTQVLRDVPVKSRRRVQIEEEI